MARVNKVICNKCGKEFDMWDMEENYSIYTRCGYGTQYDGSFLELDMCCGCMAELIESCEVTPIIEKKIHNKKC